MRYGIRSNDTVDACIRVMWIVYARWTGGTPGPPLPMRRSGLAQNITDLIWKNNSRLTFATPELENHSTRIQQIVDEVRICR